VLIGGIPLAKGRVFFGVVLDENIVLFFVRLEFAGKIIEVTRDSDKADEYVKPRLIINTGQGGKDMLR